MRCAGTESLPAEGCRNTRSLHARLVAKARQEGVSLNALVMTMIAEGLGERRAS